VLSSSKLELLDQCEGAFTLPWRDAPNPHSEAGTERHATDETAINAGSVPEEYESMWPGLTWRAEVAYAYDVSDSTSRYLGCGIDRAYGSLGPFEVPGTIDAEGRGAGILVVIDRKGFEAQTSVERHPQVRFLALAAARAQPADRIVFAIRPELGAMDVAEVDPVFDLDVIAHEVKQRVIRAAGIRTAARSGAPVAFNTGRHCRWCPAFEACPKQKELRALLVRDEDDPELALATFVDDESAADVYELYKRIGILHKRVGEQIYRHAATRPIPLRNGRMFGQHQKLGDREYDGPTVHAVAAKILGRDVADQVVEMVASQAQFERVVKPLVARGKFAATKKAVFDEVDRLGKMQRKTTTTIEEYEPGPKLVTDEEPKQITEAPF
jgi:hypothetical protein